MQKNPLSSSSSPSPSTTTTTSHQLLNPLASPSPSSSSPSSSSSSSPPPSATNVEVQTEVLPVNEAELNTCLTVLRKISAFKDWEKSPSLRPFRQSLFSFSSFPEGVLASMVAKDKKRRQRRKSLAALEDRKTLQQCALPAARLKAVLSQQQQESPFLVPDGPALTQANPSNKPALRIEHLAENEGEKGFDQSASSSSSSFPSTSSSSSDSDSPKKDQSPSPGPSDAHDNDNEQEKDPNVLLRALSCYVCRRRFYLVHSFYHSLCVVCGDLNLKKRSQEANLQGKVALVTGARVKIGFHSALKLLRCGAQVIATTRFPKDALLRFSKEPDFAVWMDRLRICSLDFRDIPAVEAFATHLANTLSRLDVLINNACQTIHRPPSYYQTLVEAESRPLETLLAANQAGGAALSALILPAHPKLPANHAALQSLVPLLPEEDPAFNPGVINDFPKGVVDAQGQQLDLRPKNSWMMTLSEVQTPELLEVFSINTCAPFILNGKLRSLMASSGTKADPKFIVNVSAMEGVFNRKWKAPRHPHTNMAKAALNMMTRTSAQDYATDSIYMTSVDTGWINDEKPHAVAKKQFLEKNFQTPLDEIDAASRILDPVFIGLNHGELFSGVFLKDYFPHPW